MKHTAKLSWMLALSLAGGVPALAMDMDMGNMHAHAAQNAETEAVGVVDDIDAAKGVLTISHQAIKSLGWPAMTMDFAVQDKKLLGKVAKGKQIRFAFVQQHNDYLITQIK